LEIEKFRASLGRHRHVALDTSIFMYHLESNVKYTDLTECLFSWLDSSGSTAVTSVITMMELLVKPYRELNPQAADNFYMLLATYPNLEWLPATLEIADLSATVQATLGFRVPDALQAATALKAGVTAIVTNDEIFRRISAFEVLVLDDYL